MEELLEKMRKYCAYQERSILEVRTKLQPSGLSSEKKDEIIIKLVEENFIDEERFTESFVRGKFKTKQWGKQKIRQHLIQKGIDSETIKRHLLSDIADEEYLKILNNQIDKYIKTINPTDEKDMAKLYRHFISKGYEYEHIKNSLKNNKNNI